MNKTALVTGAAQGLGLALCKELLARGYFVCALARRISDELRELACEQLQIILSDVTDMESLLRARSELRAEKLDLVVNNAGIWLDSARRKLDDPEFDFESMLEQYQVNALGVVRVAKVFMPLLLQGDQKTMLNISSEAGSIEGTFRVSEYGYCMSKAAQNMATKLMHNDYSEKGVRVYAIHPGWMITPQGIAGANDQYYPQQRPEDTARFLVDVAEGPTRSGLYFDVDGKEWKW